MKLTVNGQTVDLVDRIDAQLTGASLADTRRRIATAFSRLLTILWVRGEIDEATAYELVTGQQPPEGTTISLDETPDERRGNVVP